MDRVFLTIKVVFTFLFLLLISNQASADNKLINQATLQINQVFSLSPVSCHNFIAPCHLTLNVFLENRGFVDIINTSTVTANNVRAILPSSMSGVVNNSLCTTIAPGATCRLEFGPASDVHPTTLIPVVGDNTNTVYFELEVITAMLTINRN